MANIIIKNLCKSFSHTDDHLRRVEVLRNISCEINTGELITFFGPNGCGKSTLVHTVGGLLEPDRGTVRINGMTSHEARIGFVFQDYRETLFPWLSNAENIAFPLAIEGQPKKLRLASASSFIGRFNIQIDEEGYPYQQSGGQQQLLAILRALIYKPDVVLLDEPFAALDYTTRIFMQDTVLELFSETKATALFISHEIDEAIYMADRLILLSKRPAEIIKILEVGLPKPRTRDVLRTEAFADIRKEVVRVFQGALAE